MFIVTKTLHISQQPYVLLSSCRRACENFVPTKPFSRQCPIRAGALGALLCLGSGHLSLQKSIMTVINHFFPYCIWLGIGHKQHQPLQQQTLLRATMANRSLSWISISYLHYKELTGSCVVIQITWDILVLPKFLLAGALVRLTPTLQIFGSFFIEGTGHKGFIQEGECMCHYFQGLRVAALPESDNY